MHSRVSAATRAALAQAWSRRPVLSLPPRGGHPICQAAPGGGGIGESNLSYWLKKDEESRAVADPGRFEAESAEARENAMLRRRVTELEAGREILKRATVFWGKESRA